MDPALFGGLSRREAHDGATTAVIFAGWYLIARTMSGLRPIRSDDRPGMVDRRWSCSF